MFHMAFIGDMIGGGEMMIVLVAVLLLFGAHRLPEIARNLGKTVSRLNRAFDEVKEQVTRPHTMDEKAPSAPSPRDKIIPESTIKKASLEKAPHDEHDTRAG